MAEFLGQLPVDDDEKSQLNPSQQNTLQALKMTDGTALVEHANKRLQTAQDSTSSVSLAKDRLEQC